MSNREFGKEDPHNFYSEQETIAQRQGARENESYEANPTQLKTDPLCCFGIKLKERSGILGILEE